MENLKHSRKVIGIKETKNAVKNDAAKTVYVADDADPRLVQNLRDLCALSEVECVSALSRKELAKACGVDVPTAAAAVLKP